MGNRIDAINDVLLKMHNEITGKQETTVDIQNVFKKPLTESLVYSNGISGKIVSHKMVDPKKYYTLEEVIGCK